MQAFGGRQVPQNVIGIKKSSTTPTPTNGDTALFRALNRASTVTAVGVFLLLGWLAHNV